MPKFHRDTCEVCGEAVTDISKLPLEIQKKVYKPSAEEEFYTEENFETEGTQRVAIHPDGNPEVDIEIS